jgi:hypothetical protein
MNYGLSSRGLQTLYQIPGKYPEVKEVSVGQVNVFTKEKVNLHPCMIPGTNYTSDKKNLNQVGILITRPPQPSSWSCSFHPRVILLAYNPPVLPRAHLHNWR